MEAARSGQAVQTVDDLFRRLEQLNEIGASLSAERDIDRLLESILVAAKTITRADGGTLYLLTEEDGTKRLKFEIMRTESLNIAMGGTTRHSDSVPSDPSVQQGRQAQQPDGGGVCGADRPDGQHRRRLHR